MPNFWKYAWIIYAALCTPPWNIRLWNRIFHQLSIHPFIYSPSHFSFHYIYSQFIMPWNSQINIGHSNFEELTVYKTHLKDFSICNKLWFSNTYIFSTWLCTPLIFYLAKFCGIGLQRYRYKKIIVCDKDSDPL